MDGFKNIEISNFRGIRHLSIGDFARVNVFLGHNNSGKSSILEALMLLMGMSNPDIVQRVNSLRIRNVFSGLGDVRYIFYNLDLNNIPEIFSELTDGISRRLKMNLTYTSDENAKTDIPQTNIPTSETKVFLNTLEMNFDVASGERTDSYRSIVTFNNQGVVSNRDYAKGYLEKNSASFLPADLMISNLAADLAELIKR